MSCNFRKVSLAILASAALLPLAACQSDSENGDKAATEAVKTDSAAKAKDCAKDVLVTSAHAVGAPCKTTADIARSLGLTDAQIAKLQKVVAH